MKHSLILFLAAFLAVSCTGTYDVVVVGGGCAGVSASLQASRMGAKTLLVEQGPWLGGMLTSAGVCGVDGNYDMRGGIFGEFCDSIASHYGGYDAVRSGWVSHIMFEPKVGAGIFDTLTEAEPCLGVVRNASFDSVTKCGEGWKVIFTDASGRQSAVKAKVLIDGTELGDVAAAAGVPYRVGMDSRHDTGESIAPEEANGIIQDITFVAILKDYGPDADMTLPRPEGYDSTLYVNSCLGPDNDPSRPVRALWPADSVLTYGALPGRTKFMLNWPIEGNDCYVNVIGATDREREEAYAEAKAMTMGFIYFLQTSRGMKNIGIADDEFPTEDGLAIIPYHREARRIEGEAYFTVDHAARPFDQTDALYKSGIAVGNYAVDHHHGRYPDVKNLPDLHFYPIPSFNVPMGALLPKACDNLIVADKAISVTNIMNGATRVQPVMMQTGQAAGALAAIAVQSERSVKQVNVREVQSVLLADGGYIMPYVDLTPEDKGFAAVQRIGATGILRGEGQNVGWTNRTVFRTGDLLGRAELAEGIKEDYPEALAVLQSVEGDYVLCSELPALFAAMGSEGECDIAALCSDLGISCPEPDSPLTRLDFAMMLDVAVHPF